MTKKSDTQSKEAKTHTPLLPKEEVKSNFHALILFIPMLVKYLARHLTVGSYIRIRRIILRRLGRTYYV
ncbi:MAG: hypothetical protein ACI9SC_003264 [Gammaproteobacteria bacterium]|jgi:hypothetical protein